MSPMATALCGQSMLLLGSVLLLASPALADDPPKPESPLLQALKAGRVPEERQGAVVAAILKRGSSADRRYVFGRVIEPSGFSRPVRLLALEALVDLAMTGKTRPDEDLTGLAALILPADGKADPALRMAAIRLAGLWKVGALSSLLGKVAASGTIDAPTRAAALDALASLGDEPSRAALKTLAAGADAKAIRAQAVAAYARIDPAAAAAMAADLIRSADKGQDLVPLIAAFVTRKQSVELLAKALSERDIPADAAKLALRAVYALGRADAPLVAALSRAAGIEAESRPPTPEEIDRLVSEVVARGDARRGELVFRRPDLNCMKCHAVSGAAGGVGPELSSVGLSSPVDYVIRSILLPDEAIKEQYHTLVLATADGQVFQGIVADRDESRVVLREATGDLRTVPASEIEETREGGSLMPKGLANLLTRDEFLDLVKFVSELGKPGAYALHATPTVQRWRLLKPVPPELAQAVPDAGAFLAKVRDSDPSAWVSAYALASGTLPLAEFAATAESRVIYLRGEIEVASPGPVTFRLGTSENVRAWVDDAAAPEAPDFTVPLEAGRHTLTLRVDTSPTRKAIDRVEVLRPPGSSAEFVVVGGR